MVHRVRGHFSDVQFKLTATESASSMEVAARMVPRHPATRLRSADAGDEPFVRGLFNTARPTHGSKSSGVIRYMVQIPFAHPKVAGFD
jgi:hypothetical protein